MAIESETSLLRSMAMMRRAKGSVTAHRQRTVSTSSLCVKQEDARVRLAHEMAIRVLFVDDDDDVDDAFVFLLFALLLCFVVVVVVVFGGRSVVRRNFVGSVCCGDRRVAAVAVTCCDRVRPSV